MNLSSAPLSESADQSSALNPKTSGLRFIRVAKAWISVTSPGLPVPSQDGQDNNLAGQQAQVQMTASNATMDQVEDISPSALAPSQEAQSDTGSEVESDMQTPIDDVAMEQNKPHELDQTEPNHPAFFAQTCQIETAHNAIMDQVEDINPIALAPSQEAQSDKEPEVASDTQTPTDDVSMAQELDQTEPSHQLDTSNEEPDRRNVCNASSVNLGRQCVVLTLDEVQLPGFQPDYIRRLGGSFAPGLHVDVQPRWGPHTESSLTIRFITRDGEQSDTFAVCIIPTARLETPLSADLIPLGDPDTVDQLLSAEEPELNGVVYAAPRGKAHTTVFDEVEPESRLNVYLSKLGDKLVRINITIAGANLTTLYPPQYWRNLDKKEPAIVNIAEAIKTLLSNIQYDETVSLGLLFPAVDGWEAPWSHFCRKDHRRSPYSQLVPNVRDGQIDDLEFDNINLFGIDREGPRDRASTVFLSKDERTVTLITGAADEAAWQRTIADKCSEATFAVYLLPCPKSEWNRVAAKNANELYGMEPTNQPTAYFMTVPLDKNRELIPAVGTKVQVHLKVVQTFHDLPNYKVSARQIEAIASELQNGLAEAESKAYNTQRDAQRRLDSMIRKGASEEDIARQQRKVDNAADFKFTQVAAEKVWSFVTSINPETEGMFPGESADFHRWHDAISHAQILRRRQEEDEVSHFQRIYTYVKEQEMANAVPENTELGEPCIGQRIELPHGILADVALFHINVPTQPGWPPGLEAPPIILRVPARPMPANLQTYFANITRHTAHAVSAKIAYQVDDRSIKQESSAISRMNNLKENSPMAQWWQFLLRFDEASAPPNVDLLQRFPAIKTMLEEGKFKGEHAFAVRNLSTTHAGMVFLIGGPGAGKSALSSKISDAVTIRPPVILPEASEPDTASDITFDNQPDNIDHDYADEAQPPEDDAWRTTVVSDFNALGPNDRFGSAWGDGGDIAPVDEPETPTPERNGRVVWTAPQNAQVDDAVDRLTRDLKDRVVVRIYPYDQELRTIMDPNPTAPELITLDDDMTQAAQQLVDAFNQTRVERYNNKNPAVDQYSLASFTRRMVETKPEEFPLIHEAWRNREQNPLLYRTNRASYFEEGRRLLSIIIESANILAGTPVAMSYLFNHVSDWAPDLIIVDEAGRLHETMAVLLSSRFPGVPTFFVGDSKQFSPMALAADDQEYKALFSAQRQCSLLQRVEAAGHIDYTLTVNHRAHGDVHDWPRNYFYRQEMKIANGRSPITEAMQDWIIKACADSTKQDAKPESNFIFVNVADGNEEVMGTSYVNRVNARFVVELVARMTTDAPIYSLAKPNAAVPATEHARGKILIITGYSQQKRLIRLMLDQLCPTEMPPDTVSVRTIDDSPSHQAEVVICDLCRSERPGFIREMARLCVMSTRAQVLTVMVGQETMAFPTGGPALRDMMNHVKARDSFITTTGWDQFCDYCLCPGHVKSDCQERVECGFCHGEHAGRYCPDAPTASEVVKTVILDNIRRELFPNTTKAGKKAYTMKKYKKTKQIEKMSVIATGQKAQKQQFRSLHQQHMRKVNGFDSDDASDSSVPVIDSVTNAEISAAEFIEQYNEAPDTKPSNKKRSHHRTSRKGKERAVSTPSSEPVIFHDDHLDLSEIDARQQADTLAQMEQVNMSHQDGGAGPSRAPVLVPLWGGESMQQSAPEKDDAPYNQW